MGDTIHCPDCGHENPPGFETCAACQFPLKGTPAPAAPVEAAEVSAAAESPPVVIRRPPRRPQRGSPMSSSLWLVFGTMLALMVIWIAVKANVDRVTQPVEGSSPVQQANADSLAQLLAVDSTNVEARIRLADVLFDTGNWAQAIIHYRSGIRMDSSHTSAIVDLGVCYYNLGDTPEAERHFQRALAQNADHPVALFNLGIVHERRKNYDEAIGYFHRVATLGPPPPVQQAVLEAVERIQKARGAPAQGSTPR